MECMLLKWVPTFMKHCQTSKTTSSQPASVVDSMVGLDLSVAWDVLLSVDLVIIDRSLSLLTKVRI